MDMRQFVVLNRASIKDGAVILEPWLFLWISPWENVPVRKLG